MQKIRAWFMVPDDLVAWLPFALLRARRIIRQERPEVIITSSWPQSVQLIGLALKKIYGIPWMVDFRDHWARHPYYLYPTDWHRRLSGRMERWVVGNADMVTLAYGRKDFAKAYPQWQDKFHELTNGFRESDFTGVQPRAMEGFKLVYLGAFYGAHTPVFFFQALRRLVQSHPEVQSDIKVWMVGQFYPEHFAMAEQQGVADLIKFHTFVPHSEIFSWLIAADVLLLFLGSEDKDSPVVPGKVFEYIRAPGWILAMIPEGETAEILRSSGGSYIVPVIQHDRIAEALFKLYKMWKQGRKPERDLDFVKSKEENNLKCEMSRLVADLARGKSAHPGL